MWHVLKQTDIADAKQQLRMRVDETLRRQAREIQGLNNDHAELEALNRLLDEFSRKFKTSPAIPVEPVAASELEHTEAAPEQPASIEEEPTVAAAEKPAGKGAANPAAAINSDKPAAKGRQPERDQRDQSRTNFGAFTRAVAKGERGNW
jgi:hypothetical protein